MKKELLRKSNSCDTLKKVTLKNCEEVAFLKTRLSKNIATYARREIAIDPDKYSFGISYEYLTEGCKRPHRTVCHKSKNSQENMHSVVLRF